jgi:hypothetical protein
MDAADEGFYALRETDPQKFRFVVRAIRDLDPSKIRISFNRVVIDLD